MNEQGHTNGNNTVDPNTGFTSGNGANGGRNLHQHTGNGPENGYTNGNNQLPANGSTQPVYINGRVAKYAMRGGAIVGLLSVINPDIATKVHGIFNLFLNLANTGAF